MHEFTHIRKLIARFLICVILLLIWGAKSKAQTVDSVRFTYDNSVCGNTNIGFNGILYGSGVNPSDYDFYWDFGDGNQTSGQNVKHDFRVKPGDTHSPFTVTLTVTNRSTNIETVYPKTITVSPSPIPGLTDVNFPGAPFDNCKNNPTSLSPNFTISVKNSSSNTDLISNYLVDWGDGSANETFFKNQFPTTLTHTYTRMGLFKLKLTTTGDNGCTSLKEYKVKNQGSAGGTLVPPRNLVGCAPVTFNFPLSGISNNDPETNYFFDFGDGTTLTWTQTDALAHDSVSHTYYKSSCDQPGKYFTVKTTVSNSCIENPPSTFGGIRVSSAPTPNFSTLKLCEGEDVQFINTTNSDCSNNVSYVWDFGDGSPTVITNDSAVISHNFPTDKNQYTVKLTVKSACHDAIISKVITLFRSPIPDFELTPKQGCLNTASPFVVNATNKSTGDYQNLLWSVSPASGWTAPPGYSSSSNPQFSFNKKGNYTISLIASNSCKSNEKRLKISINDLVSATLYPINPPCDNYTFDATNTSIFKIDSIQYENVSAQWIITPATGWSFIAPTTATSIAPKISFTTPGPYTISVNLTNDCGTITKTTSLFINTSIHNVTTASDIDGCAPKTIDFKDFSTGTNPRHSWTVTPATGFNITNGSSTSKDVSIQFNQAGVYSVTHTVVGDCSTESKTFTITISDKPQLILKPIAPQCDPSFKLSIDANYFKIINNGEPYPTVKWNITPSDGVTFVDGTSETSQFPHIQFTKYGQYSVGVEAKNSCGNSIVSRTFRILAPAVEKANPSAIIGCAPLPVLFTDQSAGDSLSHNWSVSPAGNWTMNAPANSQSPTITFNKAGIYTVTHKISNYCGTNQHDYIIKVKEPPTATLSPLPDSCNSFTFIANSQNFIVTPNQNDTLSYRWTVSPNRSVTFPNNTSDTSKYPTIHIADTGIFVIKVAITSACGTVTKTTSLFIKTLIHNVTTASDTVGCAPHTIDFKDFSTGTNPRHYWTVTPATGFSITNGSFTSKDVSIQFNQAGVYSVTHKVVGDCNSESKTFTITISSKPQITLQPIAPQCDPSFKLSIDANYFKIINNGEPYPTVKWNITPSDGVTFVDGTSETSQFPHIQFTKYGQYSVSVEAKNSCGNSIVSRTFRILAPAVEKANPLAIIGCAPLPVLFTDQSAGDSLSHNWSVTPAVNFTMSAAAQTSASPTITFNKAGIYTVTHTISNQCGTSQNTYSIKVKEKPVATLSPLPTSCDSYTFYADQHFNVIPNLNDNINYLWTVTPASSLVNFTNSSSPTSQYPTIQIADTGVFVIKAAVSSTCGDTVVQQTVHITTSPQIALTQNLNTHCLPADLTFTGTVYGQNLIYQWSVLPNNGNSFQNGTSPSSPRPHILFTQPGFYEVTLKVSNNCSTDIHKWKDTIIGKPTILFSQIPDTCDNYTLKTEKFVTFQENGNAITGFNWTISPNTGFDYIDGTTNTSEYPHILFKDAATYQLTAEATNACDVSLPSKRSFTIDKFVQVTVGPDSTFCKNTDLIKLTSFPSGGNWRILPASDSALIKIIGNIAYFDPSSPGTYTLTYHRGNTYCFSEASKKFTVIALPVVDAGRDFSLCSNDLNPYTLTGTPAGGTWSGTGVTGSSFSTNGLPIGSYILKYSYTDPVTSCLNTDQLVAGVLDVPLTGFNAPQGCKDKPLTFIPFGTSNTKYTWDFGDGQTGSSTGPINHTYHLGGIYTVILMSADPNNCALSSSKTIKIQEEKATPSTTVGCSPLSVSFTDQSTGDLLNHNWSVSPAGNATYSPSATAQSPTITFNKTGIYTVTHTTSTTCGSDQHDYIIKVKDSPTATLSPLPNSCDSYTFTASPQNFIVTPNQNDTISYFWSVTPNRAVTFLNSTSVISKYPVIQIADTGVFVIKAATSSVCGTTETQQTIRITKKPEIALTQNLNNHCLPSDLTFTGTVYGQDLVYQWSILPNNGVSFQNNTDASSPRPQIRFTQLGSYTISLTVSNNCNTDRKEWKDTIVSVPSIVFSSIPDTCDNYTFKSEHFAKVQDNGTPVTSFNWSVVPNSGFTPTDGTTYTSEHPHILFTNAGTYTITLKATNECGVTTASRSFTADKFIQVKVGSDSTFCTNPNPILLSGNPSGGIWSILPSSASALVKVIGNITYFDPSVPGSYTLTYHRGNSYCFSEASKKFTVVALPIVDAGRDFNICSNETKPYSLNGTPSGGTWTGSGVTGNTFSPAGLAAGSYILKYSYTDPNTSCLNTDQLVARVLDVPITGFTAPVQGCKDQPVTFTPFGTANTVFNWDFGDGQTGSSPGPINHKYLKGGVYTINLTSADPNNCAYNTSKKITIQGDIIMPVVNYTPTNGCGPLNVTFTIDTTGTTSNGQKHRWDFGNGIVINDAIISKGITYNPGIADTSYTAHLTVSNNCFTRTVDYPISVRSMPNSNFSFPHPLECSPASVHVKNQTIDRRASFYWDFDDGTSSTEYEPTHIFTTGKIAKEFKVKLVATNGCGKDSVTKILLVKPNSIDAFIQLSASQACQRDTITFRNLSTDTVSRISSFYWDFGDGTIVNTWDATHAYAASGKYTIKLFVNNGCSQAEKKDQIEILPVPNLLITSRDTICKGDTLKLEGTSSGLDLINSKWDFGDGSSGTGTKTTHVYNTLGWHTITFLAADATNFFHCAGLKTKRVYIKDTPPQLQLPDLVGCAPFTISIPSPGPDAYLWNFGDDNIWTASGKHTYIINGSQPVRKKVTILSENKFLCRTTSFFWVTIYPSPVAKISVRSEGGYPNIVYFKNVSTLSSICEWLFSDGNIVLSCDSIVKRFYNNGFSKILLKTSNQYGCSDTTSVIHETVIKGLFVPNALQPSNSDPLVKIFKPVGIGLKTYHLGIYDIWGNMIWETEKIKDTETVEGWNGQNQMGKVLPQGVYIWRISATFIDDTIWKGMKDADNKTRTEGTITLIR